MSFQNLVLFLSAKYLYKNILKRQSHVVDELAFEFKSQDMALSFKEKQNNLKRIASFETMSILIVSHFFTKEAMWLLRFSTR